MAFGSLLHGDPCLVMKILVYNIIAENKITKYVTPTDTTEFHNTVSIYENVKNKEVTRAVEKN